MPVFRVVHTGDGTHVAKSIAENFSGNKYNLAVELLGLGRQASSSSSRSSSSSSSSWPAATDNRTIMAVLVVTWDMKIYLSNISGEDRTFLTTMMMSDQPAVALSCSVPIHKVKDQIKVVFSNSEMAWRYLEVSESRESYRQCMLDLESMIESQEEVPVATLKNYGLLPDKPVTAHDTVSILMEKPFVGDNKPSLKVVYKKDHQVTANENAECQFEVPESSESSKAINAFPSNEESLGYQNKLQVLSEVFSDILNPSKAEDQSPRTGSEVNESMMADWLALDEQLSSDDETQKLLSHWMKSTKSDKTQVHPVLPLFVYLCTKNNLDNVAQYLLQHLKQSDTLSSSYKEGTCDEDLGVEYESYGSSEGLESRNEDDASSSSGAVEDYVCPENIVVKTRCHFDYGNIYERKTVASDFIPRTVGHSVEREPLSKSCPPDCDKHCHQPADTEESCYENISVYGAKASKVMLMDNLINKGSTKKRHQASIKATSVSEMLEPSIFASSESPNSKDKVMLPESLSNVKPALPPRQSSKTSKQRDIAGSRMPGSTPPAFNMSSSTLSLTKLCEPKLKFYGQTMADSSFRMLPGKSPTFKSSSTLSLPRLCAQNRFEYSSRFSSTTSPDADIDPVNNKHSPLPYSCRPSPPVPKTCPPNSSSFCSAHVAARRQRSTTEDDCCSPENNSEDSSPDYSQPIELYFADGQSKGFLRSDSFYEQEETIYYNINELSESFQDEASADPIPIYDVPRKGLYRSVSADVPPRSPLTPMPTSPESSEPSTSHKKSSSRSSPWARGKKWLKDLKGNINERKTAASEFIPRTVVYSVEREPLSKSCPSDCGKHCHTLADTEESHYENISFYGAKVSKMMLMDNPVNKGLTQKRHQACIKATSVSEMMEPSIITSSESSNSKDKVMLPESLSNVKPAVPSRRNSKTSKQHDITGSRMPGSTPSTFFNMSSSTLSLTKLCEPKLKFYGQTMADSSFRMLPGKSPTFKSSSTLSLPRLCAQNRFEYSSRFSSTSPDADIDPVNNKPLPIPYSCRPSPPIPKTCPPNSSIQSSAHMAARRQRSTTDDEHFSPENNSEASSPSCSQPIELYFADGQSIGFLRSDSFSEQDEIIYENIDDLSKSFQDETSAEPTLLYDVHKKGYQRSMSADVPPSPLTLVPTSSASLEPSTSHKKSSSRSSPFSLFSKKLSQWKTGKSKV